MYTYHSQNPDYCRVYYKNDKGKLYCLQNDGNGLHPSYVFYRCTSAGEPDYPITMPEQDQFDRYQLPS